MTKYWYQPALSPPVYLKILSRVFGVIADRRRQSFLKENAVTKKKHSVPIIVIGNISVGGTGKTPLLIALCLYLQKNNINVGIISRGYGGKSRHWPVEVTEKSNAVTVGDEPLLIAQKTQCPMFVGANRNADISALLAKYPKTDVILSDDGMQHYQMQRDIEIAVIDGDRLFGNERLLPAGPLREPVSRLAEVDIQVFNGGEIELDDNQFLMRFETNIAYQLSNEDGAETEADIEKVPLSGFSGKTVHAIAGIGHPQRFFDMLTSQGFTVIPHSFDDHYQYKKTDLQFTEKHPILMTEKDAVKCLEFAIPDCWVVPVRASLSNDFYKTVSLLLSKKRK